MSNETPQTYENILTRQEDRVGLIQINRSQALNALDAHTMFEMIAALRHFDADEGIGSMVITGDERAFAAGADIKQMAKATMVDMLKVPFLDYWDQLQTVHKPLIAAVSGWCLGGGCELALACDMIVASESARFGQPEITMGVIPGVGGTQRLARTVGKALAMEMVLNNRHLTAEEALRFGLVNRVVPVEHYLVEAIRLAAEIAERAPVAVRLGKEMVNYAFEMTLKEGLLLERRSFEILFATRDRKEGMTAFIEKRPAVWQGK